MGNAKSVKTRPEWPGSSWPADRLGNVNDNAANTPWRPKPSQQPAERVLDYRWPYSEEKKPLERPPEEDERPAVRKKPTPAELGYMTEAVLQRWGRDRLPRDLEITDPWIMVVDNGPPKKMYTPTVLKNMSGEKSLRMLEPFKEGDPEAEDPRPTLALCKVVRKDEEYKRSKELKEQQRRVKCVQAKHLNIAWSIGDHDFKGKLKKLVAFLCKGSKVDVQLYHKRGGRQRSAEEAQALVDSMRTLVVDEGFVERRCDGEILETMLLTFSVKDNYQQMHNRRSPTAHSELDQSQVEFEEDKEADLLREDNEKKVKKESKSREA